MNFISEDLSDYWAECAKTMSIDQFVSTIPSSNYPLLKLDIQGHGHSALVGAKHVIKAGTWE